MWRAAFDRFKVEHDKMTISKIYIDLDGVLADFDRGVEELAHYHRHDQEEKNEELINSMWDAVRAVEHFYDKLEPIPGALEMFHSICESYGDSCDIEILTGLPKPWRHIPDAEADKRKWTARILSPDIVVNAGIREDKVKYCNGPGCVLIDDLNSNIKAWEKHGGTGILHQSPEETLRRLKELAEK